MLSNLDRTPAVKHILIINIAVYLLMNFIPLIGQHYETFALYYFDTPEFGPWQFITHMFLHARLGENYGIMHIVFNMFMLFQFGAVLEHHWGTKKFIFFYLVAGIGGAVFYTLNIGTIFNFAVHTFTPISDGLISNYPSYAVGASGAISGIMLAFAFLHPNTKLMLMFIPVPIKAKYLIGGMFAYDLVMGLKTTLSRIGIVGGNGDGIAHFAHLGGAVFGFIILMYWQKNRNTFY